MNKSIKFLLIYLCLTGSVSAEEASYYIAASYLNAETNLIGNTDKDPGYEARLGYTLNEKLSFEASYLDFGTHALPVIPDSGGSIQADGFSLSAVGLLPIRNINVIGKIGYLWWDSKGTLGSIAGPVPVTYSGSDIIIGGGLSYRFSKNIELKIEYNNSQEFKWSSVGVNFYF